jgi:hypothetical protein
MSQNPSFKSQHPSSRYWVPHPICWILSSRSQVPKPKFQVGWIMSSRYGVPNPMCRILSRKDIVWLSSSRYQVTKPEFQASSSNSYMLNIEFQISSPKTQVPGWANIEFQILSPETWVPGRLNIKFQILSPETRVPDIESWFPYAKYQVPDIKSLIPSSRDLVWIPYAEYRVPNPLSGHRVPEI